MNSCNFIGRYGAKPQFFQGDQNKKSTLLFSLAVKKEYKVAQGEADCYWLNFKAFGPTAETINKYLATGQMLGVSCSANVETFKDKQTQQDRTVTNFIVNKITFCEKSNASGGNAGGAQQGNGGYQQPQGNSGGYQPSNYQPPADDDLPF